MTRTGVMPEIDTAGVISHHLAVAVPGLARPHDPGRAAEARPQLTKEASR